MAYFLDTVIPDNAVFLFFSKAEQFGLFGTMTPVKGYVSRKTGKLVSPYTGLRHRALKKPDHPLSGNLFGHAGDEVASSHIQPEPVKVKKPRKPAAPSPEKLDAFKAKIAHIVAHAKVDAQHAPKQAEVYKKLYLAKLEAIKGIPAELLDEARQNVEGMFTAPQPAQAVPTESKSTASSLEDKDDGIGWSAEITDIDLTEPPDIYPWELDRSEFEKIRKDGGFTAINGAMYGKDILDGMELLGPAGLSLWVLMQQAKRFGAQIPDKARQWLREYKEGMAKEKQQRYFALDKPDDKSSSVPSPTAEPPQGNGGGNGGGKDNGGSGDESDENENTPDRISEAELTQRGQRVRQYVDQVNSGTAKHSGLRVGIIGNDAAQRITDALKLPVDGALEVVVANAVIHATNKHPDMTGDDWTRLPKLTNQFDDVAKGRPGIDSKTTRTIIKKVFPDGSGYGAVLEFAGGVRGRRLNLVTYFKGRGKSLEAWWNQNKLGFGSTGIPNFTESSSSEPSSIPKPNTILPPPAPKGKAAPAPVESQNANARHTLPLKSVLAEWKPRFRDSTPPRYRRVPKDMLPKVYHVSGDLDMIAMQASVTFEGQPDKNRDKARQALAAVKAAREAGYAQKRVDIGGGNTALIFVKDDHVLTPAGVAGLRSDVFARPSLDDSSGYAAMAKNQTAVATAFARWMKTLPASTLDSFSALSTKISGTAIGQWAKIHRDQHGQPVLDVFGENGNIRARLTTGGMGSSGYPLYIPGASKDVKALLHHVIALANELKNSPPPTNEREWGRLTDRAEKKAAEAYKSGKSLTDALREDQPDITKSWPFPKGAKFLFYKAVRA